jgi:hypothetical protein
MHARRNVFLFAAKSLLAAVVITAVVGDVRGQDTAVLHISVKNHRFQPSELNGPANVPFTLVIKNLDAGPMEFESVSLRVERVIPGNSEGLIRLRPLAPGRYSFFDDFHQETQGVLVIQK